MRHLNPRHLLGWAGLAAIAAFAAKADFVPQSWPTIGAGIWLLYLLQKGLGNLSQFIILQAGAFFISAFAFITLVQLIEPTFSGWADVFFFCGKSFEFCNCNLSWNLLGWYKAFVLWLFTLTTAVGFRNLLSQMVFGGLLPGEEYIDHEALQTVFIRLIPYWFNNWEQQWGVECSSLLFELPHFAVELLIILPMVQVMCRRLRPLVATRVRVPSPLAAMLAAHGIPVEIPYLPAEPDQNLQNSSTFLTEDPAPAPSATSTDPDTPVKPGKLKSKTVQEVHEPIRSATDILALDASRGEWVLDARQRRLMPRLQANFGSVCVCFALLAAAVVNVLTMPLLLDTAVFTNQRAQTVLLAADDSSIASGLLQPWDHLLGDGLVPAFSLTEQLDFEAHNATCPHPHSHFAALELQSAFLHGRPHMRQRPCSTYSVTERRSPWLPDRKSSHQVLSAAMRKNSQELQKMRSWKHRRLVIAIELLLVAMRLSCEGFPVLVATFAAYIFQKPSKLLSGIVTAVSSVSFVLQCSLYLFPAICWAYGAGVLFSMFVSVVFWAAPLWTAYEYVASTIFVVAPLVVAKPGPELMERAGPQCAICWSAFNTGGSDAGASPTGFSPLASEGASGDFSGDLSGEFVAVGRTNKADASGVGVSHASHAPEEAQGSLSGPLSQSTDDEDEGEKRSAAAAAQPPQPQKRLRGWFSLGRRGRNAQGDDSGTHTADSAAATAGTSSSAELSPRSVATGDPAAQILGRSTSNSGQHASSLHAVGTASHFSSQQQQTCAQGGCSDIGGGSRGASLRQQLQPAAAATNTSSGTLLHHVGTSSSSDAASDSVQARAVSVSNSEAALDSPTVSGGSTTPLAGLGEPGDGWDGLAEPISASTCERDTVVCTQCRHVFHFGCLSHWLHQCMVGMRATVCPLCQRTIDVDVVINPSMLFRKGRMDGLGVVEEGGEGLDETDDEEIPGEANASYATVDFLSGLMPPPSVLHLAHYPSANPQPPPIPFVARLNHDPHLLRTLQGQPPPHPPSTAEMPRASSAALAAHQLPATDAAS